MTSIDIDPDTLETAYQYVISRGFPYYTKDLSEFDKMCRFDLDSIIVNDLVRQTMHALGLAWSYFPHAWDVKTRTMKTPMDIWNDDVLLKKAVERRLKRGGLSMLREDGSMTDSQIRKALRSYSGVQSVSNFRPSSAAAIYRKYGGGVVWDMSCGFGGRLLGAYASGTVTKYIGTDPSSKTMAGLLSMSNDFSHMGMETDLHMIGSEDFVPNELVDMCFTSPPYFNTEQYADESTQSFLRYPNVDSWNNNFLRKTIQNCRQCMRSGGTLAINVANVISHKNLENDCVLIAVEEGFDHLETLRYQLSSIVRGGFKYEPIFVFKLSGR